MFDLGGLVNGLVSGISSAIINITNVLVNMVVSLVTWLLQQIPTLPIWPGPDAGTELSLVMARLIDDIHAWQYYINIGLALALVPIVLSAEIALVAWNVFRKIVAFIPFLNGASPGDTSDGGATGLGVYDGGQNAIAGKPVP